nr:esterase-like activity of phytase family protein [Acidimicrobiia bacterium]
TDTVYNIEGMTFGPRLDDGRHSLVIVSDDNFALFSPDQTQFFVLAVDIERH